jgi:SAM-dependent methyltransferase
LSGFRFPERSRGALRDASAVLGYARTGPSAALGKAVLVGALLLTACNSGTAAREPMPSVFPAAARPVASIVSARWSDEDSRDKAGESTGVMDRAGVKPGMTVADIGAGEGYYTIRLAARVGAKGRVLAQDIIPEVRDKLAERVEREKLEAVTVKLGTPDDPDLPANSFDRVFLVHMYHEIASPYAFLWNLRPAAKAGGRVVVVDADRPTNQHGTPPKLLRCEFAAVGYKLVDFYRMPSAGGYLAAFEPVGARPEPGAIKVCSG